MTLSFDVCFDVCLLNKRLTKYWIWRWFETPWCSLWRHCNGTRAYCSLLQIACSSARCYELNKIMGCQTCAPSKHATLIVFLNTCSGSHCWCYCVLNEQRSFSDRNPMMRQGFLWNCIIMITLLGDSVSLNRWWSDSISLPTYQGLGLLNQSQLHCLTTVCEMADALFACNILYSYLAGDAVTAAPDRYEYDSADQILLRKWKYLYNGEVGEGSATKF